MQQGGSPVTPSVINALRKRLGEGQVTIPLDVYIDCVLYDPEIGYYRQDKTRVGRSEHADFYTASSLGVLFSEMVVDAVRSLATQPPEKLTFIEVGPESPEGVLGALEHMPFKEYRQMRPGEPLDIPSESVLFSNELLDAQPFRRFQRAGRQWLEAFVRIGESTLECEFREPAHALPGLPAKAPDGYIIDWPSGAHSLMERICRNPWSGLFITFDYGLDREAVFTRRPEGTGRTYYGHTMGSDLLQSPAKRDITCHLIWEELQSILAHWEFQQVQLQRQEAFLMHHAGNTISKVIEGSPPGLSREKQTLMELLHPDNMGHKFQVLHARRGQI